MRRSTCRRRTTRHRRGRAGRSPMSSTTMGVGRPEHQRAVRRGTQRSPGSPWSAVGGQRARSHPHRPSVVGNGPGPGIVAGDLRPRCHTDRCMDPRGRTAPPCGLGEVPGHGHPAGPCGLRQYVPGRRHRRHGRRGDPPTRTGSVGWRHWTSVRTSMLRPRPSDLRASRSRPPCHPRPGPARRPCEADSVADSVRAERRWPRAGWSPARGERGGPVALGPAGRSGVGGQAAAPPAVGAEVFADAAARSRSGSRRTGALNLLPVPVGEGLSYHHVSHPCHQLRRHACPVYHQEGAPPDDTQALNPTEMCCRWSGAHDDVELPAAATPQRRESGEECHEERGPDSVARFLRRHVEFQMNARHRVFPPLIPASAQPGGSSRSDGQIEERLEASPLGGAECWPLGRRGDGQVLEYGTEGVLIPWRIFRLSAPPR